MESSDVIVNALQQLKMATLESLRRYDATYSFDTYKYGLKNLETSGRVKKLLFRAGTTERYVWILPWYEEEAQDQIETFQNESIKYLETSPATSGQLREYFTEVYPAHHQIAYLAFRELVSQKRVVQNLLKFEGHWTSIYYLPEKKNALDALLNTTLNFVNARGSTFPGELAESIGISKRLGSALLTALAIDGRIVKAKVGWSYARRRPVFYFCKIGGEAEAITKYRMRLNQFLKTQRKLKIIEDYSSKFNAVCRDNRIVESVAVLAGSYFDQALHSPWIRGRDIKIIVWSAFLLAAKVKKQGITPGEIERYSKIQKRILVNNTRDLNEFLGLDAHEGQHADPIDFLDRIVTRMKLSKHLRTDALALRREELVSETANFISTLPRQIIFGKRPESIAAASLYLVGSGRGISKCTQKRIARAADVTEVTLRNTVRRIEQIKPELKKIQMVDIIGEGKI